MPGCFANSIGGFPSLSAVERPLKARRQACDIEAISPLCDEAVASYVGGRSHAMPTSEAR
jgi:hypothetical protein